MGGKPYKRALEVARLLIEADCIKLSPREPFTYASGLKGPIYCDNRLLLSDPDRREWIIKAFGDLLDEACPERKPDALVGVATAGIPHAAFLSWEERLPLLYVRSSKKAHGLGRQVEGWREGLTDVVLVEDLVNQGGSLAEAVEGTLSAGLRVQACLSIVDYQMPAAREKLEGLGVKLFALTHFSDLVEYGEKSGLLDAGDARLLHAWHQDPQNWQA